MEKIQTQYHQLIRSPVIIINSYYSINMMNQKRTDKKGIYASSIKNESLVGLEITSSIREEERENDLTDRSSKNEQELKLNSLLKEQKTSRGREMLNAEQMAILKSIFEKFSSTKTIKKPPRSKLNANGIRQIMVSQPQIDVTLSEKEFIQLFTDTQIPLHKQTISHLFSILSKSKGGKGVTFSDLQAAIRQSNNQQDNEEYSKIFKIYDRNNKGYFGYEDYKYVCQGIAKDVSEAQIRQAYEKLDKDKDNKITFTRFMQIMRG